MKGLVDVAVGGAEGVNLFGPVRPVVYACLVLVAVLLVVLWLLMMMRGLGGVCKEESKRDGYGFWGDLCLG